MARAQFDVMDDIEAALLDIERELENGDFGRQQPEPVHLKPPQSGTAHWLLTGIVAAVIFTGLSAESISQIEGAAAVSTTNAKLSPGTALARR